MAFDFVPSREMYVEAYRRGMTLSALMELHDPSSQYSEYERAQGDAFQRQLAKYDIRTRSIPEAGMPAHTVERFYKGDDGSDDKERAALFPEWLSREYRRAAQVVPRRAMGSFIPPQQRKGGGGSRLLATNQPLSDVLWPEAMDSAIRYQMLEPSILSFLVGRTRMIDAEDFRAFYLDDATTEAAARMKRVSEYGEVPVMKITGSDEVIRVHKYGRRLQASYEAMRRMSLDIISWAVQYIAAKADNDKALHAIDILVNGDGNSGTAAVNTNGSSLDAAAGGELTLKMWLAWGMLWTRPHQMNVAIALNAGIVDLLLLNAGSANLPPQAVATAAGAIGQITLARPIYGGVVAINDSTAPADKIVGLDNRFSLEMVMETGADIVEVDRVISRQYQEIVLTESVGFDIMTKGQNRTLDYVN